MSGWIRVDRALFEHGAFEDPWEWGCWCWLISQAAWRDTAISRQGRKLPLKVGQLSYAQRFLATKWGCSKSKVGRFLQKLVEWDMIAIEGGTRETVITICNYADYQMPYGEGGTNLDQAEGQKPDKDRPQNGTKRNKITNIQGNKKQDSESPVVDSFVAYAPDEVREAYDFYCRSIEEYNAAKSPSALPLPKPTKLTDKRRREFKRALKELPNGLTFAEVISKAGKCPFLMGENDQGWVINFDFLLRKGKFQEIMDGKYPERPARDASGFGRGVRVSGADLFC